MAPLGVAPFFLLLLAVAAHTNHGKPSGLAFLLRGGQPISRSYECIKSRALLKEDVRPNEDEETPPEQPLPHLTPNLDRVHCPADLKSMSMDQLKELSHELRWDVINTVSKTGGHLSAGLGVVELSIALHYVFDAPEDKIVWDVSHQAYPHKILTGRRNQMHTLRTKGGLSGFCKRSESEYDAFGAGHSSTAISAGQGLAVGRTLMKKPVNHCVAVVGDGGITGGMAYEAMNCCGFLKTPLTVILNDNGQVSLPTGLDSAGGTAPTSALSAYTAKLLTSRPFQNFRDVAKGLASLFPDSMRGTAAKIDEYARGLMTGGTLFEELGFFYVGPIDGHDLENMVSILQNLKEMQQTEGRPVLLHVKTQKGYGYRPAIQASDTMHGVVGFDVLTGKQHKPVQAPPPSYTTIFANHMIRLAEKDPAVVAITAAMPGGTGVGLFANRFPMKVFDVGIAEQHAVTFAAGLAIEGVKPFTCIYSTFLQRAYDQVVHDVALQGLPVRLILDRAGFVGPDGATHHGSYDLAYLGAVPNMVIMAPSDEVELGNMIQTAYEYNAGPTALRYPRGTAMGLEVLNKKFGYNLKEVPIAGTALEIGKGRVIREGRSVGGPQQRVAILSLGSRLETAVDAAEQLESEDPSVSVTVADARFMKPLDEELIKDLSARHDVLVTLEEGSVGGFGDHVVRYMANNGLLDGGLKARSMAMPDTFIEAGTQEEQYEEAKLRKEDVVQTVKGLVGTGTRVPVAAMSL